VDEIEIIAHKCLANIGSVYNDLSVVIENLRNDRYAEDVLFWILPILDRESKRFITDDERSFINLTDEFFKFLDENAPAELGEFAKKHLKIVKQKSPSIKQLIERCSDVLSQEGYPVPATAAKAINEARNPLFHGSVSHSVDLSEAARCTKVLIVLLLMRTIGVPARAVPEL
jgi:hypothetical protein